MPDVNPLGRTLVATLLTLLVVGLGVAVVAGPAQAAAVSTTGADTAVVAQDGDDRTVNVTQRVYETDRPNVFEVELVVPEEEVVQNASITIFRYRNDGVAVVDATGFERKRSTNDRTWRMTGEGGDARITYWVDANESVGRYNAIEGSWTFFELYTEDTGLVDGGPATVTYDHTVTVEAEGVANDRFVGIGPHERGTATVGDATISIVHPEAFTTVDEPQRVANDLAEIHGRLEAGDLEGSYVGFAHPSLSHAGTAVGDDTFVVDSPNDPFDFADTWIHEHAHLVDGVRQSSRAKTDTGDRMTWFTEGFAQYRASEWSLQQGYGSYEELSTAFDRAAEFDQSLARESTLGADLNYDKGSVVLAAIDYEIRRATNDQRSFSDVHARMIEDVERDGEITLEEFLGAVENVTDERSAAGQPDGDAVAGQAREWIETTATPELWSRADHEETYGSITTVETEATVRVRTGAGERDVDLDDPRDLRAGDTLVVDYSLNNTGDSDVRFAEGPLVDDTGNASFEFATGLVEAGAETTATSTVEFLEPGTYSVRAAGERFSLRVFGTGSRVVRYGDEYGDPADAATVLPETPSLVVTGPEVADVTVTGPEGGTVMNEDLSDYEDDTVRLDPAELEPGVRYEVTIDDPFGEADTQYVEVLESVEGHAPLDVNGDGKYRDITGDGSVGQTDVATFFQVQHRQAWKRPQLFDFSGNGRVGHGDVVQLFEYVALH